MSYEWGIVNVRTPDELHRFGMTEDEACEWVREWVEECGGKEGVWRLVRRELGPWEAA